MIAGQINSEMGAAVADGSPLHPITYHENFDPDLVAIATDNMKHAATLGLPEMEVGGVKSGRAIIVGAAPSVREHLSEIKALAADPANIVFAVNDANYLLLENGIVPHGNVIFEIEQDYKELERRHHPDITYYIHSFAHPTTFDHFSDKRVVLWHCWSEQPEHNELLRLFKNKHLMVGGGVITTLSKTMPICMILGWRQFDLFGFDSSFSDDTHFNGSPYKDARVIDITVQIKNHASGDIQERTFKTLPYLARQADEFRRACECHHWMLKMRVHGDGLLPWMHRMTYPQQYEDAA
jgi:hypothetical protein